MKVDGRLEWLTFPVDSGKHPVEHWLLPATANDNRVGAQHELLGVVVIFQARQGELIGWEMS